jgi:hypothetical protein
MVATAVTEATATEDSAVPCLTYFRAILSRFNATEIGPWEEDGKIWIADRPRRRDRPSPQAVPASERGEGQVALNSGEPSIGKSRLGISAGLSCREI